MKRAPDDKQGGVEDDQQEYQDLQVAPAAVAIHKLERLRAGAGAGAHMRAQSNGM
jgi:hypothetical protein